jgi:antitoxin component YwqK of YwqJK toxin-antitoxin module
MKQLLYVLLIIFLGNTNSYAQEKTNQFNKNGARNGNWVKYYDNGNIRYQGQFNNGKEIGVFKFYSMVSDTYPTIIKTFNNNNNIAKVSFFTVEGVLESEGEMEGENRIGKWIFYNTDGKTIVSEENYTQGLLNGVSKTYYKSGKVTEILNYENGKLHGNIKRYSDEGVLLDDLNYKNGKLDGLAKYYNTNGELILTGTYENGEKLDDWQYFDNGEPANINEIKQ